MGIHPEGKGKVGCWRTIAGAVVPVLAAVTVLSCEWGAGAKGAPAGPEGTGIVGPVVPGCIQTVPDVVGLPEAKAKAKLNSSGFTVYVWVNKGDGDWWTVVHQDPAAGARVDRCLDPLVEIVMGL